MDNGVKVLPPRALVTSMILSLFAFYWNYGGALATPGSLGFYAFIGWSLCLLTNLLWPNPWTVVLWIWWTISMSTGALFMLIAAIYQGAGDEIAHATLFLLVQWGATVFLFQASARSWLFGKRYADQEDVDDDEYDACEAACYPLESAENGQAASLKHGGETYPNSSSTRAAHP